MLDGRGAVFAHDAIIWLQLQPVATRWGSRALHSEPSTFSCDGRVQCGLGEEGHFLLRADLDWGQLLLSGLRGSWLAGVPPCKSFPPLEGFHCTGGGSPGRSPDTRPLPCSFSHPRQRSQSLGEGAKFSLTPFQLLRGGQQEVHPLSFDTVGL